MAPETPLLVIIDNAPSHCTLDIESMGAARHSIWLSKPKDFPNLYLVVTCKNRSHELNSGDQFVNLNFRTHVRQSANRVIIEAPVSPPAFAMRLMCFLCGETIAPQAATSSLEKGFEIVGTKKTPFVFFPCDITNGLSHEA